MSALAQEIDDVRKRIEAQSANGALSKTEAVAARWAVDEVAKALKLPVPKRRPG